MPRIDCPEETLTSMLNTAIGSCVNKQQLDLLQGEIYSWNDAYIEIFKNMYMYMINESNITAIFVNERLRRPIELRVRKPYCELVHIFSVDFLKAIFAKIPSFSITKVANPIKSIKRKYDLCYSDPECSYDSTKINSQMSALLMRFYIAADLMSYYYYYYLEMKKFVEEDDPKIIIKDKKFIHNIFSDQPNYKTQDFIHDNKRKVLEIVRSKYQIDKDEDYQSDTSETSDSSCE